MIAFSATMELKKLLAMDSLPEKIVCFDVSNIQGVGQKNKHTAGDDLNG